jgi:hypothetical protein
VRQLKLLSVITKLTLLEERTARGSRDVEARYAFLSIAQPLFLATFGLFFSKECSFGSVFRLL